MGITERVVVVFHEKGNWEKEAFTAVAFEDSIAMKSYIESYKGILTALSFWHTKMSSDKVLKMYFEESKPR